MGIIEFFVENYVLLLAIYGAVLSTIGIIWKIYSDRPKIKVKASFGLIDYGGRIDDKSFLVGVVNRGRRPVTLSSVGIRAGKEDMIHLKTIGLPKELGEGKSHTEWFKIDSLRGKDCDFAWYRDATGKLYKSKSIRQKLKNYFDSEKKENKK